MEPTFVLPAVVTVQTVAELHPRLVAHLATPGPCVLDAGAVAELDASGAQLLFAVRAARRQAGDAARWLAVSDAMLAAARGLGMARWLGLPLEGAWR